MKNKSYTILNISSAVLLIALLLILFLINHFAPLYTDDYLYSYKFNPGFAFEEPSQLTYEKISSPAEYFQSLQDIYKNLTGRVVAHGMLQFILLFPPFVFDIINTFALLLLCYLMVRLVLGKDRKLLMPYLLLTFSLYYIAASRTVFNFYVAAFSCNYIWTQILTLAFLIPIRNHIDNDKYKTKSIAFATLMFLAGLIAGNTNEPIIPGVLVFVFLYAGYCHLSRRHVPIWIYTAFAGLLTGFGFLFFAPGNAQRFAYESGTTIQQNTFGIYFENYRRILFLSIPSLPAFIVALISLFKLKKPLLFKDWIPFFAIIIILAGTLFSIFFVPIMVTRLNILFVGFYVMAALALLYRSKLNKGLYLSILIIVLSPLLTLKLVSDFKRLKTASMEYKLIETEISSAQSDSVIVAPRGYMDPLTRANWARPIAIHYGLNYLWVDDVLDSTFTLKSSLVTYKSAFTIYHSNEIKGQEVIPILHYYDHNAFSRTIYVDLNFARESFDPAQLKIYYYSIDIKSEFWERVYNLLPLRMRLYLMPESQEYRITPYQENPAGVRFAISTRNEGKSIDYIRLRLKYKNRNLSEILLRDAEFH